MKDHSMLMNMLQGEFCPSILKETLPLALVFDMPAFGNISVYCAMLLLSVCPFSFVFPTPPKPLKGFR
jgi:hypothetical protein